MPKRATVYTPKGKPTSTTVRVRKNDGVVFRRDRGKLPPRTPGSRPAPYVVPSGDRFKDRTPARR